METAAPVLWKGERKARLEITAIFSYYKDEKCLYFIFFSEVRVWNQKEKISQISKGLKTFEKGLLTAFEHPVPSNLTFLVYLPKEQLNYCLVESSELTKVLFTVYSYSYQAFGWYTTWKRTLPAVASTDCGHTVWKGYTAKGNALFTDKETNVFPACDKKFPLSFLTEKKKKKLFYSSLPWKDAGTDKMLKSS